VNYRFNCFDLPPPLTLPSPVSHPIYITDTTLRDGQQGWRPLKPEEALQIYLLLSRLSGSSGAIRTVELFPYTGKDRETIKLILEHRERWPEPIGWVRARKQDIDLVVESKLEQTVVLTSVSYHHIYWKLGLDRKGAESKFLEAIEYALSKGLRIRVAMEDITRSDVKGFVLPFTEKILRVAEKYEADREIVFKISDTLGLGLPFETAGLPRGVPSLVKAFLNGLGIENTQLEFHGHNDFHMVVANHLAAWLSGASFSNCTLFGVGERAGNCPLEAMLLHYVAIKRDLCGIDLQAIFDAKLLFESMGYSFSPHHPIVGENSFTTSAGIHIDGLLKSPLTYLPFNPRILGTESKVKITRYSGRAGVVYALSNLLGVNSSKAAKESGLVDVVYSTVLEELEKREDGSLELQEVVDIARRVLGGRLGER